MLYKSYLLLLLLLALIIIISNHLTQTAFSKSLAIILYCQPDLDVTEEPMLMLFAFQQKHCSCSCHWQHKPNTVICY